MISLVRPRRANLTDSVYLASYFSKIAGKVLRSDIGSLLTQRGPETVFRIPPGATKYNKTQALAWILVFSAEIRPLQGQYPNWIFYVRFASKISQSGFESLPHVTFSHVLRRAQ